MKPRLLDLFCGAGGCSVGYARAGFDVVGVDNRPQPNYPFEFHQADAMTYPLDGFDVIHASPPCQHHSSLRVVRTGQDYPDHLPAIRERLKAAAVPYVIENVSGAPIDHPLILCGSMFGMRIRRHRLFESNLFLYPPALCQHQNQKDLVGVYGASDGLHEPGFKHPGLRRGPRQATTPEAREVMGMPWATRRHEITEAIPPVFATWIGTILLDQLTAVA